MPFASCQSELMATPRSLFSFRRQPHERAGFSLYNAAVKAARNPRFFAGLGVPDTLDGRFDLVALFTALVIERLRTAPDPGPALAQAVFDAMFSDMDANLREMGVGDLSVGRHVRSMWEALQGRSIAYTAAIDAGDAPALEAAIVRNVWRGAIAPEGAATSLARLVRAQAVCLDGQTLRALGTGEAQFLPAEEATQWCPS